MLGHTIDCIKRELSNDVVAGSNCGMGHTAQVNPVSGDRLRIGHTMYPGDRFLIVTMFACSESLARVVGAAVPRAVGITNTAVEHIGHYGKAIVSERANTSTKQT